MRASVAVVLCFLLTLPALAQTSTATPDTSVFETLAPQATATLLGQTVRFDYIVTAADIQLSTTLSGLLFSLWGAFLFGVFVYLKDRRK